MKKLLALLLCVMLFVSVISTSAYAAIDLSAAYDARDNLYNAYGNLAAASVYVDTVNLVEKLIGRDLTWEDLYDHWELHFHWFFPVWHFVDAEYEDLQPNLFRNVGAMSYEGLFEMVGSAIYRAYDEAGEQVAAACAVVEAAKVAEINAAIQAMVPAAAPAGGNGCHGGHGAPHRGN